MKKRSTAMPSVRKGFLPRKAPSAGHLDLLALVQRTKMRESRRKKTSAKNFIAVLLLIPATIDTNEWSGNCALRRTQNSVHFNRCTTRRTFALITSHKTEN